MTHSTLFTATLRLSMTFSQSVLRRRFLLIPLIFALVLVALSSTRRAFAVTPAPDGGYPNGNTAEGTSALLNVTTGRYDTAIGNAALADCMTGNFNTAVGGQTLILTTSGTENTGCGAYSLSHNSIGSDNTATGAFALEHNTADNNTALGADALNQNTSGAYNTASGLKALYSNTSANYNTATGALALLSNTTGAQNTADGAFALESNNTGLNNTATGLQALFTNNSGNSNTADGMNALLHNTSGSNNIALGVSAGSNLTTGSNNIDVGNAGVAGESGKIRIGKQGTQTATFVAGIHGVTVASGVGVVVGTNGQLGTVTSSARFKEAIKPMDKASESILALQPVTFRYKHELDPDRIPQFGLVAEQVEKVNPDLVARDADGKVCTVRYEAVNAMLLNEFLKEHRKVEALEKQIEALTATVQKVSDGLQVDTAAPQMAVNDR